MVELKYVKKRRLRKIVAFIAMVSVMGMTALGIVAFLGRHVGTYTVSLNAKTVRLSLSRKYPAQDRTSFLYINSLPTFDQFTYENILRIGDDVLDNQENDWDMEEAMNYSYIDNEITSMNFLKYTFFVNNDGNIDAGYEMKFNIIDDYVSTDGTNRYLSDTLRVMIYENDPDSAKHESKIYAKAPAGGRKDEHGNIVNREYISTSPDKEHFFGFANDFESYSYEQGGVITTMYNDLLRVGESKRYTFLAWLEGEDTLSDESKSRPEGASIKLGVTINGYETQQK